MIFGQVPLDQAQGGILAHNLQTKDRVLRKGALIDAVAITMLRAAGYTEITIARLEPGDVPEGEAANQLGEKLLAAGLRRSADVHGRVNLFAAAAGLLRIDRARIEQFNGVDESLTLATLQDRSVAAAGAMVATLKIIPFAVTANVMAAAKDLITGGPPLLIVKPFQKRLAGLVLTTLPQLKDAALQNTVAATAKRIAARTGTLLPPVRTLHETAPIANAIRDLATAGAQIILVSGASAVTDRHDIAPMAVLAAGGVITHFGMPVDPGNLICFGQLGDIPVVILPGCARSPRLNGIDWVLDRIFAGEAVGANDVAAMGAGGLLAEMPARPAPRLAKTASGFGAVPQSLPRIAGLVLAAGTSSRSGAHNKLLAKTRNGETMIGRTVDHLLASGAGPVIVVTGHDQSSIEQALADKPVRFVYAGDYAVGLSASLRRGIAALAEDIGAALICLGDMPRVDAGTMRRIIAAYNPAEGRDIILPVFDGQRGNPVLWGRRFFPELMKLGGDAGGRQILHNYMEFVAEVPVETDSVVEDFDTPDALAVFAAK